MHYSTYSLFIALQTVCTGSQMIKNIDKFSFNLIYNFHHLCKVVGIHSITLRLVTEMNHTRCCVKAELSFSGKIAPSNRVINSIQHQLLLHK